MAKDIRKQATKIEQEVEQEIRDNEPRLIRIGSGLMGVSDTWAGLPPAASAAAWNWRSCDSAFGRGEVACQQGSVPARQGDFAIWIQAGRHCGQCSVQWPEIAPSPDIDIASLHPQQGQIRRQSYRPIAAARRGRPIAHHPASE